MLNIIQENESQPWYRQGLPFKCTGCGKCCSGSSGYVFLSDKEIVSISKHLKIPLDEFRRRFLRQIGPHYSLKEIKRGKNYDCIFLKDNQCQIYEVRPTQCKTFPFWPRILKDAKSWQETAHECEGIQSNAPLVTYENIEKNRRMQSESEL